MSAAPLDLDVDTAGDFTRWLEGHALNFYPDPPEHVHRCPDCGDDWTHRDEECTNDAVPDPWYRGSHAGGYAACPECEGPVSNGTQYVWCGACQTFTLADLAGAPACCGVISEGDAGYVNDPTLGWAVSL